MTNQPQSRAVEYLAEMKKSDDLYKSAIRNFKRAAALFAISATLSTVGIIMLRRYDKKTS